MFEEIYIDKAATLAFIGGLVLFLGIFELIRKRRLLERYALLWFLAGSVIICLSLSRKSLDILAKLMGIYYPPSALFVIAALFFLLILLHFSVVTSELTEKNRKLAQQISMMDWKMRELQKKDQPQ